MLERAAVLLIFVLSVKWDIWSMLPDDSLLGGAFVLAFIIGDTVAEISRERKRIMSG